jgi:hypothetical protein
MNLMESSASVSLHPKRCRAVEDRAQVAITSNSGLSDIQSSPIKANQTQSRSKVSGQRLHCHRAMALGHKVTLPRHANHSNPMKINTITLTPDQIAHANQGQSRLIKANKA